MNKKVLMSMFFVLIFAAVGLPFWLDVPDYEGKDSFIYQMFLFCLLGGFWILAFSYFVTELKKINDKVWKPIVVLVLAIGFVLNNKYGGLLSVSGDGVSSLFSQPIIWLLAGTIIGYLVLLIYNRSKHQPS